MECVPEKQKRRNKQRARCRTTMWRSKIWNGTRRCKLSRTRVLAATSSRLPRGSKDGRGDCTLPKLFSVHHIYLQPGGLSRTSSPSSPGRRQDHQKAQPL